MNSPCNQRNAKKSRSNVEHPIAIVDGHAPVVTSQYTVHLKVSNNSTLTRVDNTAILAYAEFVTTNLEYVDNLTELHTLIINGNDEIVDIGVYNELKVQTVQLVDVSNLSRVRLNAAIDVVIKDCINLASIELMSVEHLTLINCETLSSIRVGPNLSSVTIANCSALRSIEFIAESESTSINKLEIINCGAISNVCGIENAVTKHASITIRECPQLHGNIYGIDCGDLTIDSCPGITRVVGIVADVLTISRCEGLVNIDSVDVMDITISYCVRLRYISPTNAAFISVSYCERLFSIAELMTLRSLNVVECRDLREFGLRFNPNASYQCDAPRVSIRGDFGCSRLSPDHYDPAVISGWRVSSLKLDNCGNLVGIENVHQIESLIIDGCVLEFIKNMIIPDELIVNDTSVQVIRDILGPRKIDIRSCFDLYECVVNSSPSELCIIECEQLIATFDGSLLEKVYIDDCQFIYLSNLIDHYDLDALQLNITNVPNVSEYENELAHPNADDDEIVISEQRAENMDAIASFAVAEFDDMRDAASKIAALFRGFRVRKIARENRAFRTAMIQMRAIRTIGRMMLTKSRGIAYKRLKAVRAERLALYKRRIDAIFDEASCIICMNDLDRSDCHITSCIHGFHSGCIEQWFQHSRTCPICKAHA